MTPDAEQALDQGSDRFLRLAQVRERTGMATSTIYDKIAAGEFPRPVKISTRLAAWSEREIVAWMQARLAERGSAK